MNTSLPTDFVHKTFQEIVLKIVYEHDSKLSTDAWPWGFFFYWSCPQIVLKSFKFQRFSFPHWSFPQFFFHKIALEIVLKIFSKLFLKLSTKRSFKTVHWCLAVTVLNSNASLFLTDLFPKFCLRNWPINCPRNCP